MKQDYVQNLLFLIISLILLQACQSIQAQTFFMPELQPPQAELPWWNRAKIYNSPKPSKYYNIKSDLPAAEVKELAKHLDMTFESYRKILGSLTPRQPVTYDVMIFAKRSDYQTTLGYKYGVNATGSGGMFFKNIQGSALAFWTENLPISRVHHVLQHEGFHQVAAALFPMGLSPWVNEGLAEFFGEAVMINGELIIGQTNPRVINNVKNSIETSTFIPFRQMLQMNHGTWNANVASGTARLQYAQAWSMVQFLVYAENEKYAVAFSNFLRHLNNGESTYDAFVTTFKTDDIESFEARWKEFAQQSKPSSFVTARERIEFLAEGLLELRSIKMYPKSIEELREKLQEIKFSYKLKSHGVETELKADDAAMYVIPRDDLIGEEDETPVFELVKINQRKLKLKARKLHQKVPFPSILKTKGLRPREITINWVPDYDKNTVSYELDISRKR